MSWLSGKPKRVLRLSWPSDDPLLHESSIRQKLTTINHRSYTSVLDDRVLCAFTATAAGDDGPYTAVYLADVRRVEDAVFEKIAMLDFAAIAIALVADKKGFVTLQCLKNENIIVLRQHSWNGSILSQKQTWAAAVYGSLVVARHAIGICVSSGQAPAEPTLQGIPYVRARIDLLGQHHPRDPSLITGDQIVVWLLDTDELRVVQIPQDDGAILTHEAEFQFVGENYIAIGGTVVSSFGRPSALLKSFEMHHPENETTTRTFSHGQNFDSDDDIGVIGIHGSSDDNCAFVASYHHDSSRLTVLDTGLLTGRIDSEPTSDDPGGLHPTYEHPQNKRTIQGTVNESLSSVSRSRVLVALRYSDTDARYNKYTIKGPYDYTRTRMYWIYDFDQTRVTSLLALSTAARAGLEERLKEENEHAQVTVVSRNFSEGIEEEDDMEYPYPTHMDAPEYWKVRLMELYRRDVRRKKGEEEMPALEFDEGPEEKNDVHRIVFSKSAVWFPEDEEMRRVDGRGIALTTSALVYVGAFGKEGRILYFGDSA